MKEIIKDIPSQLLFINTYYIIMNSFKIGNCEIVDKALKINDTLIISDLHFGYESSLNRQGLMIPMYQYDKIIEDITQIQDRANCSSIILNGDIKHNFGTIDKQEWKEVLDFIDYLYDLFVDVRVIKGNHDTFTQYILSRVDLELEDFIVIDNYYITHGHMLPDDIEDDVDTIIIGHEHPSISLKDNERQESIKVYLKGTWNGYDLIVMPSFTSISYGSDILNQKTISPYIKDINSFEVIGVDQSNVYPFGLVEDLLSINGDNEDEFVG